MKVSGQTVTKMNNTSQVYINQDKQSPKTRQLAYRTASMGTPHSESSLKKKGSLADIAFFNRFPRFSRKAVVWSENKGKFRFSVDFWRSRRKKNTSG